MKTHASSLPTASAQDDADAREFEQYARQQDTDEVQAALWATRWQAGLDAQAQAAFQAWLAADRRHGQVYEEMQASFGRVRQLPDAEVQALRAGLDLPAGAPARADAHSRPPPPRRHRPWMRAIGRRLPQMATAAAVAMLVGASWLGWDHWRSQPVFTKHYATERGQRLNVQLPDGSALQLDAATHAEVRLYRQHREVRLADGQIMFTVSSDPGQPFDVLAGAVRVTVVGTRFSVRHTQAGLDAGKTVVAVESGRVRVARRDGADDGQMLDAASRVDLGLGQSVAADSAGRLEPVASIAADGVAAWRNGRVTFNDTPLAQALAEFERYGDTKLVVRDSAVAAMRLGGSFELQQMGAFAQALPHLLPVRLERRGATLEIVGTR